MNRYVTVCLALLCIATLALAQDAPQRPRAPQRLAADQPQLPADKPVSQVEVVNFPPVQAVAGGVEVTNLPAVQPVSGSVACSNLPLDGNGNVKVAGPGISPGMRSLHYVFTLSHWESVYSDWIDVSEVRTVEIFVTSEGACQDANGGGYNGAFPQWRFADDAPVIEGGAGGADVAHMPGVNTTLFGSQFRVRGYNGCGVEGVTTVHVWVLLINR